MPEDPARILASSHDKKELSAYGRLLARSTRAADHEELGKWLPSGDFLARLDEPERYLGAPGKTRIAAILRELSDNRAPSAEAVLVALTRSSIFNAEPLRTDILIRACVPLRPAPPDVVRFWDEHWLPDDAFAYVTPDAVSDNGSAPALALLERKMADVGHPDDDKQVWMVTGIMMHRNEPLMLESCDRMLRGGIPENLRPLLVEVIFDYRPTEWFRPATVLVPPDRKLAGPEARERLRRMGAFALQSVALTDAQKDVVRRVLRELDENT